MLTHQGTRAVLLAASLLTLFSGMYWNSSRHDDAGQGIVFVEAGEDAEQGSVRKYCYVGPAVPFATTSA